MQLDSLTTANHQLHSALLPGTPSDGEEENHPAQAASKIQDVSGTRSDEDAALTVLDAVATTSTRALLTEPAFGAAINSDEIVPTDERDELLEAPIASPAGAEVAAVGLHAPTAASSVAPSAPDAAHPGNETSSAASGQADDVATDVAQDAAGSNELSEEEQQEVGELKKRDRQVREHEQAHVAAAGQYATGGPTFEYKTGPDGRRYAVGGEVDIDTSEVPDDSEATVRKAQVIYRAAMAPAEPSSQDRRVAAEARKMQAEAQAEIGKNQRREQTEKDESVEAGVDGAVATDATGAMGQDSSDESGRPVSAKTPEIDIPEPAGRSTFDGAGAGQVLDLIG